MKPNPSESLFSALSAYANSDMYPFHMPGHKRNTALLGNTLPYALDITEIDGFDNLHQPEGILQRLSERLASLYESAFSLPLINGSTGGILAGIASFFPNGGSILAARNCHKSVYNAITLLGLTPYYLYPPTDEGSGIAGSIPPQEVARALEEHPEIGLVVLTSPTYDGVLSDIREIVRLAHEKGVPVLVDEAHGAHLQFTPLRAYSAVHCGADLVIQSLHKTLPAFTQCAVAHINGTLLSANTFLKNCGIFETSSPSYILLASIDRCVTFLETEGREKFAEYEALLNTFSASCTALQNLSVLCKGRDSLEKHKSFFAFDGGKLPILTVNTEIDGSTLLDALRRQFHIEGEMAAPDYALCMTSPADTKDGFERLSAALQALDRSLSPCKAPPHFPAPAMPKMYCTPKAAGLKQGKFLPLSACAGKVAQDFLWCYPPGIPLLAAGEEIEGDLLSQILSMQELGLSIQTGDKKLPDFRVLD